MKPKKILISLLAVALATAVTGVWMTSCSPAPEQGGQGGGEDIAIPKTLLFENTSQVATNFLRSISYQRTEVAHKFYIKTTVNVTNYFPALRALDSGLGNSYVSRTNTGDIWGLLIIGIDRNSKSTQKKNVAKFGTTVRTADPNFEFDAVIRLLSDWNNANLKDGIPVRAEDGTWYLETYTSGDNENLNYWDVRSEKKFQADDNDTDGPAAKFISGAYSIRTNIETNPGATNTYRVDANISYDSSTGEYVLTIPFTLIDANDINKITAFGLQNSGWRPGSQVNAVIKPLGSSKTIVYADANGVVRGLPVVTVPKNKNESPTLIQGVFQDVITSISTTIDAKAGVLTNTNSITLLSSTSNASNIIVFTGPQGSSTVNVTNWLYYKGTNALGEYEYTNTIVLIYSAVSGGGANFYAGTNYSVSVSAGNGGTATISVTVEPTVSLTLPVVAPGSSDSATVTVVDGYSAGTSLTVKNSNTGSSYTVTLSGGSGTFTIGESSSANLVASNGHVIFAIYSDATSSKSFTNSATLVVYNPGVLLGPGQYNVWGNLIKNVYAKSDGTDLTVSVEWDSIPTGNNLYLLIDVTNLSGIKPAATDWSGDWTTGWDNFWFTNTAQIDADFAIAGWYSGTGVYNLSVTKAITNGNGFGVTGVSYSRIGPFEVFTIPYSKLGSGASSGNVVNIYAFFGKSGGTAGNEGMRSMFPANASITNNGSWGDYIVDVTNKSTNYTLQ
ncbi:MAG: hypothetical protein N3D81_06900 [Spirochaetes bacterium]|nr:hypothetical protein [Spirochaetota bacterium]